MHSAKIQIRPHNEEVINSTLSEIANEKINITKKVNLKEGVDIEIDNATFAVRLSKKFKKRFGCEVKITRSLVGENKTRGKRIHKLTVLLRIPKPYKTNID